MLTISSTTITIPTYHRGPDTPLPPLDFSGQIGARRAYPYSMQDDIDLATMKFSPQAFHRAVILNNGILEAVILPDMNGRLYSLRDLRTNRELFYRNNVVKPGLVALRGAWLSGGVEFNFPTIGHSVSTIAPVVCTQEKSPHHVAAIVTDLDRTTGQTWQVKMTLRENRAALDIETTLHNPNHYRERLYYWENAAVPATDDLQFTCRCDWTVGSTQAHPFPQRNGKDISFHKNNPTPIDHFGYRSYADFFGAYYHDSRTATYHLAPRHQLPGQKYFTWGTQIDDKIWQHYLTDADGSYIEIQAGLLETQWTTQFLDPHQTITTHGSWFGTHDAQQLTWANNHLALAVDTKTKHLDIISIDQTAPLHISIKGQRRTTTHTVTAQLGQTCRLPLKSLDTFHIEVHNDQGVLLLREIYSGVKQHNLPNDRPTGTPNQWPMLPAQKHTHAKLEMAEKYHNWTSLNRNLQQPADDLTAAQTHLLYAQLHLKNLNPQAAYDHALKTCLDTPTDTYAHLTAAAAQLYLQQHTAGLKHHHILYDHILVARRDQRYYVPALRLLAESYILLDNPVTARGILTELTALPQTSPDTLTLYLITLRHCNDTQTAQALLDNHANLPPCLAHEAFLLAPKTQQLSYNLPQPDQHTNDLDAHRSELILHALYLYYRLNLKADLARLLPAAAKAYPPLRKHPLFHLLLASSAATEKTAWKHYQNAEKQSPAYIFPHRYEDHRLLDSALTQFKNQHVPAPRLTYLYALTLAQNDHVPAALKKFRTALKDADAPLTLLIRKGLADYAHHADKDYPTAVKHLRAALKIEPHNYRLLIQLDNLYYQQQLITPRAKLLAKLPASLCKRGDITYHLARLAFDQQQYQAALDMVQHQQFTVYEGGTTIRRLYVDVILALSLDHIQQNRWDAAAKVLPLIFEFPLNLGAASYLGEHSRLTRYLLGLTGLLQDQPDKAAHWFTDTLAHTRQQTTYVIGAADAVTPIRPDEYLALHLAARRLNQNPPTDISLPRPTTPQDQTANQLVEALLTYPKTVPALSRRSQKQFPCSPLLAILNMLITVENLVPMPRE